MKRCQIVTIALIPALSLLAEPTHLDIMKPDLMDTDLAGSVKSVETKTMFNVSGKFERERQEYDRTGNLLTETEWDLEGELYNTLTNHYSESGSFEQQIYIDYDDKFTNDWEIILSPETRQIAKKNKKSGAAAVSTFSEEGYLINYRYNGSDKKLRMATSTKRNAQHKPEVYTRLDSKKKPIYTYWFKWKENGRIEREHQKYRKDKAERLHIYDYLKSDDQENWTQRLMVRYDIGGDQKEKVWERLVVRSIDYYDEETEMTEEVASTDSDALSTNAVESLESDSSDEVSETDVAVKKTEPRINATGE